MSEERKKIELSEEGKAMLAEAFKRIRDKLDVMTEEEKWALIAKLEHTHTTQETPEVPDGKEGDGSDT